jgi:ankyrin repeat protein
MNIFFFALSFSILLASHVKSEEILPSEKTDLLTFLKKNRRKDIDQDFLKTVKLMIENGADVNQSKKGGSPFEEALHRKNVDLTKMMIEAKAIITEDHLCHSNLRSAPEIINLFLSHGAPLNPKKCNLFYADNDFNFKVAKILLERGATIPPIDQATGDSFVHHMVRHGRGAKKEEFTQFLDYLISKKIDIALKNKWGQTPLFYFAVGYTTDDNNYISDPYGIEGPISKTDFRDGQGDEDFKSYYLISKYTSEQLNQVDDFGNTAIHALASIPIGHKSSYGTDKHTCPLELFKTYKAQGGKIGLVNKLGYSPLHICKGYFNFSDLSAMLKLFSKDELNHQDLEGNSALHSWVQNSCPPVDSIQKPESNLIQIVYDAGMKIDLINHLGQTPLFLAITAPCIIEPMLKLLSREAINHQDKKGDTALHFQLSGIMKLRPEIAKRFISHGARKDIKNKLRFLPYDLVKNANNKSEFEFLKP